MRAGDQKLRYVALYKTTSKDISKIYDIGLWTYIKSKTR